MNMEGISSHTVNRGATVRHTDVMMEILELHEVMASSYSNGKAAGDIAALSGRSTPRQRTSYHGLCHLVCRITG